MRFDDDDFNMIQSYVQGNPYINSVVYEVYHHYHL